MTNAVETAVVQAGAPELIAVLEAVQTFVTNLGSDPLKTPLTVGPALTILVGTIGLQLPALATSEFGALQTEVNTKIGGLITKLKALPKPA